MKKIKWTAAALASALMCACSSVSQQTPNTEEPTATATVKDKTVATTATASNEQQATPTEQQQASAAAILQQQQTGCTTVPASRLMPLEEAATSQATESVTTGIPGRSGLRLGRFAPPEEAASTKDANAITPNTAEQRGLRSPALPTKLPLDVNGQSNNHNGQ